MAKPSKSLVVCLDNESGEDYLFPKSCFAPAKFPESVRRALMQAA
jgi:hypothetical protein